MKYDTTGGVPTRDGAYQKLMRHLSEAADSAPKFEAVILTV